MLLASNLSFWPVVQVTDVQTLLGTQRNPKLAFNPHGAGSVSDGYRCKTVCCVKEHAHSLLA